MNFFRIIDIIIFFLKKNSNHILIKEKKNFFHLKYRTKRKTNKTNSNSPTSIIFPLKNIKNIIKKYTKKRKEYLNDFGD